MKTKKCCCCADWHTPPNTRSVQAKDGTALLLDLSLLPAAISTCLHRTPASQESLASTPVAHTAAYNYRFCRLKSTLSMAGCRTSRLCTSRKGKPSDARCNAVQSSTLCSPHTTLQNNPTTPVNPSSQTSALSLNQTHAHCCARLSIHCDRMQ